MGARKGRIESNPTLRARIHQIVMALDEKSLWLSYEGWRKALRGEFGDRAVSDKCVKDYLEARAPEEIKAAWRRVRGRS